MRGFEKGSRCNITRPLKLPHLAMLVNIVARACASNLDPLYGGSCLHLSTLFAESDAAPLTVYSAVALRNGMLILIEISRGSGIGMCNGVEMEKSPFPRMAGGGGTWGGGGGGGASTLQKTNCEGSLRHVTRKGRRHIRMMQPKYLQSVAGFFPRPLFTTSDSTPRAGSSSWRTFAPIEFGPWKAIITRQRRPDKVHESGLRQPGAGGAKALAMPSTAASINTTMCGCMVPG